MDSVREKITIELARSKIRTEEIYAIIKQIADHIEPPTPAPVAKPAPAPAASTSTSASAKTSASTSTKIGCKENYFTN